MPSKCRQDHEARETLTLPELNVQPPADQTSAEEKKRLLTRVTRLGSHEPQQYVPVSVDGGLVIPSSGMIRHRLVQVMYLHTWLR